MSDELTRTERVARANIEIAREAAVPAHPESADAIRAGKADNWITVRSAMRALTAIDAERDALREALPDDECAICGGTLAKHKNGSGVGMCMVYPVFRSRRQMFDALYDQARSLSSVSREGN